MLRAILGPAGWGVMAVVAGCVGPAPFCSFDPLAPTAPLPAVYVGAADPFGHGDLAVETIEVPACQQGAPVPLRIHAPRPLGAYAVVVFQHGFMLPNRAYDALLRQVASHGFVVVAPQMYEPSIPALLGWPSAEQEAITAGRVLDWLPGRLDALAGVSADLARLGLAGHSRGGKVVWRVLRSDPSRALAAVGVDPVDGTGGPLGNQPRVADQPFGFVLPTVIFGAGRAGACAPAGENYRQFYDASAPPAWLFVAPDAGHADMLDPATADLAAAVCPPGADPDGARRLIAGLMVALFRATLQGDPQALDLLSQPADMPVPVASESK